MGGTFLNQLGPRYPWDYNFDAAYEDLPAETIAAGYMTSFKVSENTALRWGKDRVDLNRFYKKFATRSECFSRMTFLSRKAAELMHYDNNLIVGEDAYQYHQLRKLAHDGVIDMRMRKERWAFSYVQIADRTSVTRTISTHGGGVIVNYDWMRPLTDALNKLEPELPVDYSLPEFIDPYYEVKSK